MKRILLLSLAAAVVALPACRRGVVEGLDLPQVPVETAAPLDPVGASEPIVEVVRRVRPSVVNVATDVSSLLGGGGGTGTGFIVSADGIMVTNYHVVEGASTIRVVTDDHRRFQARVIGGDPAADLAVLKVEAEGLPTVELGTSGDLELGQPVVALGFALALEGGPSVTSGIVSAVGRTITAGDGAGNNRTYEDLVQTDAAINPGNSGGPLVDLEGRVVGINTAGVQASAAENIGFAIAIDRAKDLVEEAIANPAEPQAYLGISSRTVDEALAFQFDLPVEAGALVVDVVPGGPADRAGIVAGDVIATIGTQPIETDEDVRDALQALRPEARVPVALVREDGTREVLDVTLGVRPFPVPTG